MLELKNNELINIQGGSFRFINSIRLNVKLFSTLTRWILKKIR